MRSAILATTVMMLVTLTAAQTKPLPPATMVGAGFAHTAQSSADNLAANITPSTNLFFCPPKTCLYYSGDTDTSSPNNNGLFDIDNPGIGITDAEVWVGVKPRKNATVTGTSGNYITFATSIGINPTPFAVQTGITAGHAGKTVCKTSGNATFHTYGECEPFFDCVNYYISKLKKSCKLKKGKVYFVSMQPQYNDNSTVGYLSDDDGGAMAAHANKQGWPEIKDHSYFNSSFFGADYQPTWGSSGACAGIQCTAVHLPSWRNGGRAVLAIKGPLRRTERALDRSGPLCKPSARKEGGF